MSAMPSGLDLFLAGVDGGIPQINPDDLAGSSNPAGMGNGISPDTGRSIYMASIGRNVPFYDGTTDPYTPADVRGGPINDSIFDHIWDTLGERVGVSSTPARYAGGRADPNSRSTIDYSAGQVQAAFRKTGELAGDSASLIARAGSGATAGVASGFFSGLDKTTWIVLAVAGVIAAIVLMRR